VFLTAQLAACFSERDASGPAVSDETCDVPISAITGTKKAIVAIRGYTFYPDTLRVSAGTTVTWVNCDDVAGTDAHTTTSSTGVWSSPFFPEGQTYTAPVFNQAGAFPYFCTPHPSMRGTIIVQ
jgi:plastocyanin